MSKLAERATSLKLRLVAMTDPARGDPKALAAGLPAGSWLILRHYGDPDRSFLAKQVACICRGRRIKLLIAGDLRLAVRLGAGLHLPEHQAMATPAIRLWHRRGGLLSAAAHGRNGLGRRVDAALLSPIFATDSHPDAKPLGLLALRRLARTARVPVFALGGITAERLWALRTASIAGVAAIGALAPAQEMLTPSRAPAP
jgi:thiamine-phosphate pyrophosphorylase